MSRRSAEKAVLRPVTKPDGSLTVGQFADPEGNVIGLAGPT
jgi:predicted enzyme related to lactoylglutathione lyase